MKISKLTMGLCIAAILPCALQAEEMTFVTYYPAPMANYSGFTTTQKTTLATSGGNVGIGTTDPQAKLHVAGDIKLNNMRFEPLDPNDPNTPPLNAEEGNIYFNKVNHRLYIYLDPDGAGPQPADWKKVLTQDDITGNAYISFLNMFDSLGNSNSLSVSDVKTELTNYVKSNLFPNDPLPGNVNSKLAQINNSSAVDSKMGDLTNCSTDKCKAEKTSELIKEIANTFKGVLNEVY